MQSFAMMEAARKNNQVLFVPLLLFAAHGESQEAKPEEEGEGYGGMTPRLSADTEALH